MTRRVVEADTVVDAGALKLTLRRLHGIVGPVVVDWLRFTCPLSSVALWLESSFDPEGLYSLHAAPDGDFGALLLGAGHRAAGRPLDLGALAAARGLALRVVGLLGADFSADLEPRPGRDFYQFRIALLRAGAEVGWIGGGASSTRAQQDAQARTLHCNLYGEACLFVDPAAWSGVAALGELCGGVVTRCDLALDFFAGLGDGEFARLVDRYKAGDMDVRGKRPRCAMAGDWAACRGATFYLGSRESGKLTRLYQKGDQLAGVDAGDPWVRCELQYGNSLRVLDWAMLTDPAPYFAGASDFHAELLERAGVAVVPVGVPQRPRAVVASVVAECARNLRWLVRSAGPTVAAAFRYLADSEFLEVAGAAGVPGRLAKFSTDELRHGYENAARLWFSSPGAIPAC